MRNKKESLSKLSCFSRRGSQKKATLLNEVIIHIILIGIIFALFLFATAGKINARGVRQQVLEKQTALLLDSAVPGMSFEIEKNWFNGLVYDVRVNNGRVFIAVAGLDSFVGYPYFSRYSVDVEEEKDKFIVRVYE